MSGLYIDGQKQPRPEPFILGLRDLDILRLPQPLVFESVPLEDFVAAGGWVETVPMELEE